MPVYVPVLTIRIATRQTNQPSIQRLKSSIKLSLDREERGHRSFHKTVINLRKIVTAMATSPFIEAFDGLIVIPYLMVGPSKIGPDPYAK